jgi:nucleoid-associated protein YgaU
MQAQSRTLLFSLSSAVAVGAIAFISWRIADQNPRTFSRADLARPAASEPVAAPQTQLALKGDTSLNAAGGASISSGALFDIVRVEPTGEAVVAGRAQPGATVRLLNNGVVIAQVKADANGQFAIVPPPLGVGDHQLSLQIEGAPASASAQTVAVVVPADRKGEVVVALTEPGAATRILSDAKPAASSAGTILSIRSVEVDEAGGFYATGSGAPGSTIRLSLNGAPVTTVTANDEGRWTLKVERGMNPGAYTVRADHLDSAGRVIAQAEAPFDYPTRLANAAARTGGAGASGSDAVVEVQSVTVQRGDSLWRISQRMLGNGQRYTQLYAANSTQIRNPSLIFPKQILVVPQGGAKATN